MTLENQVVSLELAQKLKELGVKQESEFRWVPRIDQTYALFSREKLKQYGLKLSAGISAFTVAELGEMLPKQVNFGTHSISYWEWRQRCIGDQWEAYFDSYIGVPEKPSHKYFRERTEANARAKMLIYLIENNLVPSPNDTK